MTGRCVHCGEPVGQHGWHRVTGWERKALDPDRRGGSDITLRTPTGEVACWRCVDRLKSGLSPGQQTLGGEAA